MEGRLGEQRDFCFDILRGLSRLSNNPFIADVADVVAKYPNRDLSIALNHKQIASKLFLCDRLLETLGPTHQRIWIMAGWYGVLAAMLFDDPRFDIGSIVSFDINADCVPVAVALNRRHVAAQKFEAQTHDICELDYRSPQPPSLIINTSCEHLYDVQSWLNLLEPGTPLVLQSNDYRREPDHLSCVDSVADFERQARLSTLLFSGTLPAKNYNRFMLIGRR